SMLGRASAISPERILRRSSSATSSCLLGLTSCLSMRVRLAALCTLGVPFVTCAHRVHRLRGGCRDTDRDPPVRRPPYGRLPRQGQGGACRAAADDQA